MRPIISFTSGLVCLAVFLATANASASASQQCQALPAAELADTELSATSLIVEREGLPPFCQVEGQIAARIGSVMRLPADNWNGKLAVTGCGGFCGSLLPEKPGYSNSMNEYLKGGYAVIQTDGGHQAESWDTDWALGDDTALDLYAGAWMPLAVATGRHYVANFYASAPRHTYFTGCSNGGRLGLFAAQRYPELFDGIAAGGGIFDLSGNAGVHGLWLLQSTRDEQGRAVIDASKIPLLERHVMAQCDHLDGVRDGVISRPALCQPEVDKLGCGPAGNETDCFTAAELAAVKRLYQGATVDGEQLYPGIPPGSEALWPIWITGTDAQPAWGELAAEGYLRLSYGVPSARPFKPHDYVLSEQLGNIRRLAPRLNATDPDLSAFARAGGKLFYYHGLADPLILPGRAREYYEEVVAVQGREKLDEFARFVMVPGQGHCWEQPGRVADDFNPLAVLDRWVESGIAPDTVMAVQRTPGGAVVRSRQLCALPAVAHFDGGDDNSADSFSCATVATDP